MGDLEFLHDLLLNPRLTNYIILVQIPIVICLIIQAYQAYKIVFKEFRFITIAWSVNLVYLGINVFLKRMPLGQDYRLIIRTSFDLLNMWFFLFAVSHSFEGKLTLLRKIPKTYFLLVFLLAGLSKIVPGSLHMIPYVHLRFVPAALLDFAVLFLLAQYFKTISKKVNQKPVLFYITLFYAILQFISVLQIDKHEPNFILLNIDNIGFIFGLLSKLGILISLSLLLINYIKVSSKEEKDKLLHKLQFATKILNIKGNLFLTGNPTEHENNIIKSVLDECLNLLNEKLGYYGSYNNKLKNVCILFASENYQKQIHYVFPVSEGITGKAIMLKETQEMKTLSSSPEYEKFPDTIVDKDVQSAVAIPVILDNQVLGVYMFESEAENYFSYTDVNILKALVSQAQTAIKNIRLIQEIEVSKTLFDSLKEIDKNLVDSAWDLKSMLELILRHSLKLVKGEIGNISLKATDNDLQIVASTKPELMNRKIDIHDSISGLAFLKETTVYVADIENAEEIYKKLFKNYLGDNACDLAIPLIVSNEVIGVLNIESSEPDIFTTNDIEKVKGFAGQASIAIHIFQLLEFLRKHRASLEALAELEQMILSSDLSLTETLDAILKKGLPLIKKEHGEILLLHHEKTSFIIKKSTSVAEENQPFPLKSISGLALKVGTVYLPFIDKVNEKPIAIKGVYTPSEEEKKLYTAPAWGKMKSELVVPLILKAQVIGVLNIESPEYNAFPEDERKLLVNFAYTAAIAIHKAQLSDEINVKNTALENSVDKKNIEMIVNLGNLINHRVGNEIGAIRMILRDELLQGDFGEFSEDVIKEFKKMLSSAESVLAANQISETVKELLVSKLTPIDFNEVKSQILKVEDLYSREKITIEMTGFEFMKPSLGSLKLFMEVFLELISNARKAMPKGGKILIKGEVRDQKNIIIFEDHGCGIPKENIEKIFEKGWSSWKKGSNGGGIGLSDVRLIIVALGGRIDVKSVINSGTTFSIEFPVVEN